MPEVAIFDYGAGNLLSLKCALKKVGLDAKISIEAQEFKRIVSTNKKSKFFMAINFSCNIQVTKNQDVTQYLAIKVN